MEEYPEELRTPPVALIAVVGCPELHGMISTHLHSEQPPINTLALPDFSKVSLMAKKLKDSSSDHPPSGILKRDWLPKHRTRIPAVFAALYTSAHLSGYPAQWLQLCSDLENLKSVIRARNIKLVIVVVQSTPANDISEDRMLALRKRAEVDSKYFVIFNQTDSTELKQSLNRLGTAFAELANIYYRDVGRRIKMRVEKKNLNSLELNIRYCFKVAAYAEFRRDWVEALRFYEEAYHTLREMIGTSTRLPAIQRLVEIKNVAEQLHFKISTLLLHGGKVIEAVRWFRQHSGSYRKLVGAPEAIFLHWEWMSRQYLAFAELMETSSAKTQSILSPALEAADRPLTEWEFSPAYYYELSAHYLKEKKYSLELALSMSESDNEVDGESVESSVYVGQFARLLEQGDGVVVQLLSDEEYVRYALAEGKRSQDSFEIIALLKKSHESYSSLKVPRIASYCWFQMAKEYFSLGETNNAKKLFDGVASLYRKEGWVTLLWEVLGYLRECSRKHGIAKDFIEYSLEMAAIPVSSTTGLQFVRYKECSPAGPPSLSQRETVQKEVFELACGESGCSSIEDNDCLKVTEKLPLHLEIDLISPLRVVLLASVAFHDQIIKPGSCSLITLSLLSQLPLTIEIDQLDIQFNQPECNFTVINAQKPSIASNSQQCRRVETASSLALGSNKWLRLTYEIKSELSGKLECVYVVAKMGPHFTICCCAESPASMDDLPLWKFEDRVETFPTKDPALAFTGQKATQVEEPDPQVDLNLAATGPALVGESFIVPVTVTSEGHDIYGGELKINLVDVKGGGLFSPRETESSASDSHHVELIGIAAPQGQDESNYDSEKIEKIQHSFGLVSVPFLRNGESWSCKLEIKWHKPKPVMLYVSLGYVPHNNEYNVTTAQKIHVHRSLQIEGKTAVVINHRLLFPFRRDPLLLSRAEEVSDSDSLPSVPLNETTILVISSRNCTEVPLQLQSMTIDADEVQHRGDDLIELALLAPGKEFKKVFTVIPKINTSKLRLGTVCLRWRRESGVEEQPSVLTKHTLPEVNVDVSPLIVTLESPPNAILGDPFTFCVKIQNQTQLLQELKFSLADSQSFLLSGSHQDTIFVLPKTEHILTYNLVPLASGSQVLPRISLSSVRYSAAFHSSTEACTVFVFPSKPHFEIGTGKTTEPIVTE